MLFLLKLFFAHFVLFPLMFEMLPFLQIGARLVITAQEDRCCEPRSLHLGSFSHDGLGGGGPGRLLTRKSHYPESRAWTR